MVEKIHVCMRQRMSYDKIMDSLSLKNPKTGQLIELVSGIGVHEFTDLSFGAQSEPHMQVGKAIAKLSFEGCDSYLVIILPTEEALKI
jgi:hypothetical protein